MKKREKLAAKIAGLENQIATLKAARDEVLALRSLNRALTAKAKRDGAKSPSE